MSSTNALTDDSLAHDTINNLKKLLDVGYKFTNSQIDVAMTMALAQGLPEADHEVLKDVAESNGIPMWQAVLGQFRRCHENGLAFAPILDPGWQPGETIRIEEELCEICANVFMPKIMGQKFCGHACGVIADQRARGQTKKDDALLQAV